MPASQRPSPPRRRRPIRGAAVPAEDNTPAKSPRPMDAVSEASPGPLLDITTIEASFTVEVKDRGVNMWVKVGATSKVPDAVSPTRAARTLSSWVEKRVEEKVQEMLA